jgi:C4-dicarboxylate-specific signal transduction histidine kinase
VRTVAKTMIEVFSVQAVKKGVRMNFDCEEQPLLVRMGVGELEQVISNLVINSLDAVDEQAGAILVRVAARPTDGVVTIAVEDNGPGVAAEHMAHIFDPFFSTKEIGAGTGLGLTVVYGMVTDVGGSVEVERSTDLGGARFIVTLPRVPQPSAPTTAT